jgi:hypothetical protein
LVGGRAQIPCAVRVDGVGSGYRGGFWSLRLAPIAVIAPSQGYLYDIEESAGNTNLVIFMSKVWNPNIRSRRSCVSELANQFASQHPGQSQNADTQQG